MANNNLQLNFDDLTSIAKMFKDEGEDLMRLHSTTRQKVRDMHKEWIGEAADKFFDEMETVLLPAVQRLSQALFLSQDTASEIMKIIREADEETAGYFNNQLGGDDFGAGKFGEALAGLGGGQPQPGGADDFGAGKFGEAVGGVSGGGSSGGPDDFGAGKFEDALPPQGGGQSAGGGQEGSSDGGGSSEKSDKSGGGGTEPESAPAGGGGGGSESSESQGLKGDLKNMGVGASDQAQQSASAGGGSGGAMPDHVYSSEGGGGSPKPDPVPGGQSKPGVDTSSGEGSSSKGAAAGAAGTAAAGAAAAAAKAVKGKQKNG